DQMDASVKFVDSALGLHPPAEAQPLTTNAGELVERGHVALALRRPGCSGPQTRVVLMLTLKHEQIATIGPSLDPVAGVLRVGVADDLLIGHDAVAQAGGKRLPVVFRVVGALLTPD